jgi:hypothetical protein
MTYAVESYSGPESNPLRLGLVHSILLGSVEKIILVAPMP